MTTSNNVYQRRTRVRKRVIPELAKAANKTPRAFLEDMLTKFKTQEAVAEELGVSQGTVSREILIQGVFDSGRK